MELYEEKQLRAAVWLRQKSQGHLLHFPKTRQWDLACQRKAQRGTATYTHLEPLGTSATASWALSLYTRTNKPPTDCSSLLQLHHSSTACSIRTSHCTTDTTTTNSSRCQHLFYLPHTKIIYRQSLVRQIHSEMQSDSHRIKCSPEPSIKTDKPFSLRLKFMPAPQNMAWIDPLLSATRFCWNWIQIRTKLQFACFGLIYFLQDTGRQACLLPGTRDAIKRQSWELPKLEVILSS